MRRTPAPLAAILALTLLSPCALPAPAAAATSTAKVPKPVLTTINARFKNPEIKSVATEVEKGSKVYELGLTVEKKNVDVIITPAGELVLFEQEIARTDLPAAVLETLDRRYPHATYRICEEVIKVEKKQEKLAFYETLLQTAGKQWLALQISSEGKVLVSEKKKSGTLD